MGVFVGTRERLLHTLILRIDFQDSVVGNVWEMKRLSGEPEPAGFHHITENDNEKGEEEQETPSVDGRWRVNEEFATDSCSVYSMMRFHGQADSETSSKY